MKYIKISWVHDHPREPVWLFSELDEGRWETRKVEIFTDGSKGFATKEEEIGGTFLGEHPVPMLNQIASDPQFVPEEISREEFEKVWQARRVPA